MQRPEHSFDEGVLTATDQRGVEFRLGLERRHQVAIGECSFQFGERVADPANDGRIVQACAFTSGKSFENGASRVELFCLLETDGADDGTAMGNRVDQAVGLQQPKRINKSLREVTAIWRAIQSGDPDLAEQCCVDHIKAAAVAALSMIEQSSAANEKAIADE